MATYPDHLPLITVVYNKKTKTFREGHGMAFFFKMSYSNDTIVNRYYKEGEF